MTMRIFVGGTMLHIIGPLSLVLAIIGSASATPLDDTAFGGAGDQSGSSSSIRLLRSGSAQAVAATTGNGATEKPITGPPSLAPSGHNIISNVYFPIEKVNKNLISTRDGRDNATGSAPSSASANNGRRRQSSEELSGDSSQKQQKLSGLNDLRPETDLINSQQPRTSLKYNNVAREGGFSAAPASSPVSRAATNVTIQLNNHAYLNCKLNRTLLQISQVSNKSVSWVRMLDDHILTVNRVTFIADDRFNSFYDATNGVWTLQIKYVRPEDAGVYECQVSTEPKLSAQILLNVVVPKTEVVGEPIRYVKAGSNVILRCIVREALEPPIYISWFYNHHQIYNENSYGWKMAFERNILTSPDSSSQGNVGSVSPLLPSSAAAGASSSSPSFYHHPAGAAGRFKSIGSLIIPSVRKRDTGNYTCSPSNSAPVIVMLHVIHGDYSASAITSSSSRGGLSDLITIIISVAMLNGT